MLESVPVWEAADLQEELFLSPEKSLNIVKWTAEALLEAVTTPMSAVKGFGDPPIHAIQLR